MSVRLRIMLLTMLAVALAVVSASLATYAIVKDDLRGRAEAELRTFGEHAVQDAASGRFDDGGGPGSGGQDGPGGRGGPGRFGSELITQMLNRNGSVAQASATYGTIQPSKRAKAAAQTGASRFFEDASFKGTHVLILNIPGSTGLIQVARPINAIDNQLESLRNTLLWTALAGLAAALLLGGLVARSVLKPIRRLTAEAATVAETRDLSHRIDVHGTDELSQLGTSFNSMLGALDESQNAQRQLVVDASHELRTPLTSVRTNVELLGHPALSAADRSSMQHSIVTQLEELSALVGNLVEIGYDSAPSIDRVDVQLDVLAAETVERSRRLAPQVTITTDLDSTLIRGVPQRLERALSNAIDNAIKWSTAGSVIEVGLHDRELTVRDHGPGIDAGDLPHVFDRFYRSDAARSMPGSGLGLALVKQVADEHRADVSIEQPADGGTLVRMRFS